MRDYIKRESEREADTSSADGSPVRGEGPVFDVAELVGLRASAEDWLKKGTDALWGFRRTDGEAAGSFWKDSRPVKNPTDETPNVTTTARACIGLLTAERAMKLKFNAPWETALQEFSRRKRVFNVGDTFYEAKPRVPKENGGPDTKAFFEEQNNFDIAHLADFILTNDYLNRFRDGPEKPSLLDLFGARKDRTPEPLPDDGGPETFEDLPNASAVIARRLRDALHQSTLRRNDGGSASSPTSRGEVFFERNNESSAHYFVTLHALRALHMLGEPLPNRDLKEIVAGARDFSVEQCYYHMRGTTQKQDPVRLAFAGCIYVLYEEHVDKDLCLAVIETLEHSQQSDGSWPTTHPIIRKRDRAPWHISSHEVALCLTWLYFQPRVPDAGRPRLLAMMRRYFDRAVAAAYHPGLGGKTSPPSGLKWTVRPEKSKGWQDDHTRSHDITVGWANAVVCHFLANFVAVLDDWINRCVIDDLGLSLATESFLIDETVGKPSKRWSNRPPRERRPTKFKTLPTIALWPDVSPHAWRLQPPGDLGDEVLEEWTDPTNNNALSRKLGQYVLSPIFESPREEPNKRMCAGLLPGQPGTRKTSLVGQVADVLEWPMVAVPAALIFKYGFEHMEAQASRVFWRLNHLRRCVIFFDEFEEFFLSRDPGHFRRLVKQAAEDAEKAGNPLKPTQPDPGIPYESRTIAAFTTSAMLPRLQDLHDEGRCLIFFATNHLEKIDSAIMRVGRVDFMARIDHPGFLRLGQFVRELSATKKKKLGLYKLPAEMMDTIESTIVAELLELHETEEAEPGFSYPQGKFLTVELILEAAASKAVEACGEKKFEQLTKKEKQTARERVESFVKDHLKDLHERQKSIGPPELATYEPPLPK